MAKYFCTSEALHPRGKTKLAPNYAHLVPVNAIDKDGKLIVTSCPARSRDGICRNAQPDLNPEGICGFRRTERTSVRL